MDIRSRPDAFASNRLILQSLAIGLSIIGRGRSRQERVILHDRAAARSPDHNPEEHPEERRMRVTNVIARVLAGCAGLLLAGAGSAQSPYPDRPVKIIGPFAAAGPTDVVARLIAQKLSEKFGQQFYTENMGGAGGNLGMAAVARSPADGYTILFSSSSYTVNPSLYAKSPYDPDRDFAPVTKAAGSPNGLFVHPSIPAKSVKELVDLLKANPGKYTFASPGIGTTPHLSSELFKLTFGLDFALAPFPGGGPSIQSVVGGHTPMCFQAIPPATPLVKDGKLRALAITAKTRSPALPDVPTLDELGIKDQEAETMQGVLVPAGTPKPIIDLLQTEIARIVNLPDVRDKMLAMGLEPDGMSSAEFAAYIKADVAKWKKVIADAKIPQIGG
jgi:tripartite-type tricarboxylate transporter receptor subunit TctC